MIPQVQHWKSSPEYQAFIRQVHMDVYVGLKNGEPVDKIREALQELCDEIVKSIELQPLIVKR